MSYHLEFTEKANEDIDFHKRSGNSGLLIKLLNLFEELTKHPFIGTGKPEQLKQLTGCWSRSINREHRFVYDVKGHFQ